MEKINIAELLENCPKGMELDCTLFDDSVKVVFDSVDEALDFVKILIIRNNTRTTYSVSKYGQWTTLPYAKCVIFPKGKTTWEGFVPPCKFKDGDIVATNSGKWLGIVKNKCDSEYHTVHCAVDCTFNATFHRCGVYCFSRLATEEEKQTLFKAIKENGYSWNAETKTLEKLVEPKFKVGDRIKIVYKEDYRYIITQVTNTHYTIRETDESFLYTVPISEDENWELVPNKFDVSTLIPFESRVLVRTKNFHDKWIAGFFSHKDSCEFAPFWTTADKNYQQCIPYENNEHLLGKDDDCDEFYKTWE